MLKLVFFLVLLFTPLALNAENYNIESNSDYIVTRIDGNEIKIFNIKTNRNLIKKFDADIEKMELSYSYPYISIILSDHRAFIYDIAKNKLFYLGGGSKYEKRWSRDGKFTFINHGTSFIIVSTNDLVNYLSSENIENLLSRVKGQPLGFISQEYWLNNNWLIYSSGVGEAIAYGAFNIENKKNYFITGCGFINVGEAEFLKKCEDIGSKNLLIEIFLDKLQKGNLKEITFDFYGSILKILEH